MYLSFYVEKMFIYEYVFVKICNDMFLDWVILVGCGVIIGFGVVFYIVGVVFGEIMVVIGCGGIGFLCVNGGVIVGVGCIIVIDCV